MTQTNDQETIAARFVGGPHPGLKFTKLPWPLPDFIALDYDGSESYCAECYHSVQLHNHDNDPHDRSCGAVDARVDCSCLEYIEPARGSYIKVSESLLDETAIKFHHVMRGVQYEWKDSNP